MVLCWSRSLAQSHGKLKPIYLQYHSAYSHQSWYNGDIPWRAPNYKVIQRSNHVVLEGHMTDKNHFISTTRMPMISKFVRMIVYLHGLLPIKLHDPLITCPCKIMRQTKTIISLIPQCLWPTNLVGWWVTLTGSYH